MKYYIVTVDGRLFLSYAKDPKVAIKQIMNDTTIDTTGYQFDDFRARSVGNLVANHGVVMEMKVVYKGDENGREF